MNNLSQPLPPISPAPAKQLTWDDIRLSRNLELQVSDWTVLPDTNLSNEQKQAWLSYRQALRNLPQDFSDPNSVVWPQKP